MTKPKKPAKAAPKTKSENVLEPTRTTDPAPTVTETTFAASEPFGRMLPGAGAQSPAAQPTQPAPPALRDYAPLIPTVGRILHYMTSPESIPRAAILAAVHEDGELTCFVFDVNRGAIARKRPLEPEDHKTAPDGYFIWPPRL